MRKTVLLVTLLCSLVAATTAAPAGAATTMSAGGFTGVMEMAADPSTCGEGSLWPPDNPGSSLIESDDARGSFDLALAVSDVLAGTGALSVCGLLEPTGLGIGASCLTHKGYAGTGAIDFLSGTTDVSGFGWVSSVGYTIPFEAVLESSGKSTQRMGGWLQRQGGAACVTSGSEWVAAGFYAVSPDMGPVPNPVEPGGCSSVGTEVESVDFTVGTAYTETTVYQAPSGYEVCLRVEQNGSPVVDESVFVSTQPPPPPPPPAQVDPDAPAGDGTGSPCNIQHFEGGSSSTRAYVRESSTTGPSHVCVGVRNGGSERHVRVTIG